MFNCISGVAETALTNNEQEVNVVVTTPSSIYDVYCLYTKPVLMRLVTHDPATHNPKGSPYKSIQPRANS